MQITVNFDSLSERIQFRLVSVDFPDKIFMQLMYNFIHLFQKPIYSLVFYVGNI